MCIPEFVADKVHSKKDLWQIDIGNISGFFMQYADTSGSLWFPLKNEYLDEYIISEWNMNFSQNHNGYDVGIVMIDGKWSLAQSFYAIDDTYEKRISWQTHIFSIINAAVVQM